MQYQNKEIVDCGGVKYRKVFDGIGRERGTEGCKNCCFSHSDLTCGNNFPEHEMWGCAEGKFHWERVD